MSICARVVVPVPFHEVHNAPNTKACADGNNESLQNGNSLIKEFHSVVSPDCSIDKKTRFQKKNRPAHLRCCLLPAMLASPFIFIKISLLESQKCRDQSDKLPVMGVRPDRRASILVSDKHLLFFMRLILRLLGSNPLHSSQILHPFAA